MHKSSAVHVIKCGRAHFYSLHICALNKNSQTKCAVCGRQPQYQTHVHDKLRKLHKFTHFAPAGSFFFGVQFFSFILVNFIEA